MSNELNTNALGGGVWSIGSAYLRVSFLIECIDNCYIKDDTNNHINMYVCTQTDNRQ